MFTFKEWKAIDVARRRLCDEKDKAIAKIFRLNKQERLLNEQERKMVSSGLGFIDELEALEEKEEKERKAQKVLKTLSI